LNSPLSLFQGSQAAVEGAIAGLELLDQDSQSSLSGLSHMLEGVSGVVVHNLGVIAERADLGELVDTGALAWSLNLAAILRPTCRIKKKKKKKDFLSSLSFLLFQQKVK